jgi:hypothetical protein
VKEEVAERYGALSPLRGKWDMKLIQDYNFKPFQVQINQYNSI